MPDKADTIELKVVTPNGVIYDSEVKRATIPTESGEITIYPDHAPLISILKPGEIQVKKEDYEVGMSVSKGVLEVQPDNKIYALADTAERATSIDIEQAKQARERAREILEKKRNQEEADFDALKGKIKKETARIHVGQKYKG